MFEDQLFLFFQDLLNDFLVILAQLLDVVGVLDADFVVGGHAVAKPLSAGSWLSGRSLAYGLGVLILIPSLLEFALILAAVSFLHV